MKPKFYAILAGATALMSCYVEPYDSASAFPTSNALANCAVEHPDLVATSAQAVPIQALSYSADFKRSVQAVNIVMVTGSCAPMIDASSIDIVRLSNGRHFRITADGFTPIDSSLGDPFQNFHLSETELPNIPMANFVQAVRIQSIRADGTLSRRYVGLWRRGNESLLVDFTVPRQDAMPIGINTLLTSRLPIRSISFLPAPDTATGSLGLVQEAGSAGIRLIRFGWNHGNMPRLN